MKGMQLDPITTEIIRNALIKAADDIRAALQRTAYSPVIYEGVDLACGIIGPEPTLIAETSGVPAFLGNLVNAVSDIQRSFPGAIEPDDIFTCNDPYDGGGTHCNDVLVATPIFVDGGVIAYSTVKAHVLDIGGIFTGGWYNNTTEIFQEGLRIPPVKLYRRGEANDDIFRIMRTNSRLPDALVGDIRAMVSAVRVGKQRVLELIQRYGLKVYQAAIRDIQDHAERISRAAIARIPDGFYEAEFFLDGDGDDDKPLGDKLRVHVAITIAGEEITVDLSGSSDQSPGPLNSPRPTSISYVRYGVKSITMPGLPSNEGCFRPLKVILRPNSIFDPRPPAPTTLWVEASQNIPDLMLKALAPAMPERVRASTFGSDVATFVYGTHPQTKRTYLLVEESAPGGWGARPDSDGETALHALAEGDTYNIPMEMIEAGYPLRVGKYALVRDSGGPGRYRGGLGVIKTLTPMGHDCRVIATFERSKYSPAWGLFGGDAGGANRLTLHRRDASMEPHVKVTNMLVSQGETVSYEAGGGGGYGPAFEREPERVLDDVRNDYVSNEAARRDYGVAIVIGPGGLQVDEVETRRLRSVRGPRGSEDCRGTASEPARR
jgi:N-methylhydantoinase B